MKRFSVHPMALVLWLWIFVVLKPLLALGYILAIVVHEFGHYVVAKKLGYKLSRFCVSPYGVSLNMESKHLEAKDQIKIATAGPLFNFVSAILVVGMWWCFPMTYVFLEHFVRASCLLALLNLLPAYPLDGGRIFISIVSFLIKEKTAKKIAIVFNLVFSLIFFVLFILFLFVDFNPTFLLFSIFLISGLIDLKFNSNYEKIDIYLKERKNFVYPQMCCIYEDVTLEEILKKIQSSKTHIFCFIMTNGKIINLSEKMVFNLSLKYNINQTIGEIFKIK